MERLDGFVIADYAGNNYPINENGISWSVDTSFKFHDNSNWTQTQWLDVQNEHFINWMQWATTPDWMKLWGRIDVPMPAGNYSLFPYNSFDVSLFQGSKYMVISTVNGLGGTSQMIGGITVFFGICYILLGAGIKIYLWYKKISDDHFYETLSFDWKSY